MKTSTGYEIPRNCEECGQFYKEADGKYICVHKQTTFKEIPYPSTRDNTDEIIRGCPRAWAWSDEKKTEKSNTGVVNVSDFV